MSDKPIVTEEAIADFLNAFAEAIEKEDNSRFGDIAKRLKDACPVPISKPSEFFYRIDYPLRKFKDVFLKLVVDQGQMTPRRYSLLLFVYDHFDFVQNHIDAVIRSFDGRVCSGDKTSWVISKYIEFLQTGTVPESPPPDNKEYYIPAVCDLEIWLPFCQSLEDLHAGNVVPFMDAHRNLIQQYLEQSPK